MSSIPNIKENKLGQLVRQIRNERGYSLRKFEKLTGISFSHLSKIERGEHTPEKHTLDIIADNLEIDKDQLYVLAGYVPEVIQDRSTITTDYDMTVLSSYFRNTLDDYRNRIFHSNDSRMSQFTFELLFEFFKTMFKEEDYITVITKNYKEFGLDEEIKETIYSIVLNYDTFGDIPQNEKNKLLYVLERIYLNKSQSQNIDYFIVNYINGEDHEGQKVMLGESKSRYEDSTFQKIPPEENLKVWLRSNASELNEEEQEELVEDIQDYLKHRKERILKSKHVTTG